MGIKEKLVEAEEKSFRSRFFYTTLVGFWLVMIVLAVVFWYFVDDSIYTYVVIFLLILVTILMFVERHYKLKKK